MSAQRPVVRPASPWRQPTPAETTLPNGIRLLTHDVPGQQVIAVRTVLPVSLADEPREVEGITVMLARILDEGAGDLDAEAFALALERQGAVLGAGALDGALSVDMDVPVRHLEPALRLLTSAVAEPLLPEDEVRRVLRNRIAEYDHESASAPHRAARELLSALWADEARASRPTAGTPATIEAIDRAALRERHDNLGVEGASVVIVGALDGVDVGALAASTLGAWTAAGRRPAPVVAPTPRGGGTRIVVVDRPGSVQSEFALGTPSIGRSDSSWPAHPVLAYLLGGSPNARLDALLREDKGYTYGIRASMRPRVAGGSFVISGSVRSEVTAESLDLILGVVDGAREGFPRAEIAKGVDFITRATPGRWATADAVADETAALAVEGLPWDFQQRTLEAMARLGPDDLASAMAGLAPEGWATVIVADAEQVVPGIEALGVGTVEVVSD